jgi:5'(3')-deoxyribonucleotidase
MFNPQSDKLRFTSKLNSKESWYLRLNWMPEVVPLLSSKKFAICGLLEGIWLSGKKMDLESFEGERST